MKEKLKVSIRAVRDVHPEPPIILFLSAGKRPGILLSSDVVIMVSTPSCCFDLKPPDQLDIFNVTGDGSTYEHTYYCVIARSAATKQSFRLQRDCRAPFGHSQ
jgi:hypothetical protein